MTSVNTNASATTALRTLQATNKSLETTQNRISTGLKIGEAKDNAAYWAISTTLKSDNKALSTVKDALSLGAATVDTAYQALNKTLEVLDDIKSKLTAASQDGVDKVKIQAEIKQLQDQLKSVASGASFSGENWLNVDSTSAGYSAVKQVVSSYTRDLSGSVAIGTIGIDITSVSLIDAGGTSEGLLEGGTTGNALTGGLSNTLKTDTAATKGNQVAGAFAVTGTPANVAKFVFSYTIDGVSYTTSTTPSTMLAASGADAGAIATSMVATLNNDATFASRASISQAAGVFTITSNTTGTSSTAAISGIQLYRNDGTTAETSTLAAPASSTPGAAAYTTMTTNFSTGGTITLDANDSIEFDVTVDGVSNRATVSQALVNDVLGVSDGKINNITQYQLVLKEALRNANVTGVTVGGTTAVVLTGGSKNITIGNVNASKGTDILSFDMSNASAKQLTSYIRSVNSAAERVTSAAATLGAVAKRVDSQKTFVDTLIDTIDKGVGELIDADLSEESTRLQALQTKQQLGVQALSIANSSTQNILRLFQ